MQASAATGSDPHQVTDFNVFPLREPVSKRAYTLIRLRTRSGLTGYGECAGVTAAELDKARRAVLGQPATSFGVITTQTSLDGAITAAMIDIAARAAKTPVYRLLGGPTRTKVRALASLTGGTDDELKASMATAQKTGYRAFQVPVPLVNARNQGQAFDRAVKARMQSLRSGTDNLDFVLDGGGRLSAGDASSVAATWSASTSCGSTSPARRRTCAPYRRSPTSALRRWDSDGTSPIRASIRTCCVKASSTFSDLTCSVQVYRLSGGSRRSPRPTT